MHILFIRCRDNISSKKLKMKYIRIVAIIFLFSASVFGAPFQISGKNYYLMQNDGECADSRDECASWAKKDGYCDYEADYMKKYCKKSCQFCTPPQPAEPRGPLGPVCQDIRENCTKYASIDGYCDYQKEYMAQYCPKSCNFCERRQPFAPSGSELFWVAGSWGPCKDEIQKRPVRCYHNYGGKSYHVAIKYCEEQLSAEKPSIGRSC